MVWNQSRSPCSAPRLSPYGLLLCWPSYRHSPPPNETYLRNGNASCWHGLCDCNEIARPHQPSHDHALSRCDLDRPSAGVSTGSLKTQASGSSTQSLIHTRTQRPGWPHRFLARHTTCNGNVPPITPKRTSTLLPRPAHQPPHQDPRRVTKSPHHLNENGQRLDGMRRSTPITAGVKLAVIDAL